MFSAIHLLFSPRPRYVPRPDFSRGGRQVYHRREPSAANAEQIEASGELWGFADRDSDTPTVDAWVGPLSQDGTGIEFETDVPPDEGLPPHLGRWTGPRDGVEQRGDRAVIRVRVLKNTQSEADD